MSLDLSRFHQTFFEESFEGLDTMESALLRLDPASVDAETINTIFRAAHSIKGGGGTFGFTAVSAFTHLLETLLDQMRSGSRPVTGELVNLLLSSVDAVRELLNAARDGRPANLELIAGHQTALEQALANKPSSSAPAPAEVNPGTTSAPAATRGWRIRFAPQAGLFRSGNDPLRILRELASLGSLSAEAQLPEGLSLAEAQPEDSHASWNLELLSSASEAAVREAFAWVEDECELQIAPLPAAEARPALTLIQGGKTEAARDETPTPPRARSGQDRRSAGESTGSIRVPTDKIDVLINLVGELVITQAMLAQTGANLDPVVNERLLTALAQLDRNTRALQESVMGIRMLPMDFVFSRFPRLVHDLAGKLGKKVRLETFGADTELDKSVIEKIADPLTHLVRNALDHGIETGAERLAAGKPEEGVISLRASHRGGSIVIEIADDGRGLSRERILAKARSQGLEAPDSLSDAEVHQLIFAPGFSTAEVVTDVSGRGVGMDVVKKNILALNGQVDLASRPGQGTRVSIRLPLTLAILDGMSVAVGEEVFIVPLAAVVESLQAHPEDVKTIGHSARVVRVRNEMVPLMALHELVGLEPSAANDRNLCILIESEGRKLALGVDDLLGQQQVVVKNLESNYRRVPNMSGATILGDGRVALILDAGELVRRLQPAVAA
ncbi:MAG: chemotaxis protein CheA [Nevskiaceae bacterium]|nr:MAG: chemotaxis protein CheA [Nevskiaceae bacterium]TAM23088.1 MAG: chemotaxis protein CheA [Nevskiaceae bacterium]